MKIIHDSEGFEEQVPSEAVKEEVKTRRTNGMRRKIRWRRRRAEKEKTTVIQ